ncbi:MAG: hypothetical protein ACRD7E_23015 [Bryobacteraceae bacterium]
MRRFPIINMKERPLSVTAIGCLYIVAGAIGLAYHFTELDPEHLFEDDVLWILLVRLTAIVCGIYVLRGSNWARWLALAWIAYHVVLSGFHSWFELAVHSLLCAVFAFFLFRPRAAQYFRIPKAEGCKRQDGPEPP